MPQPQAAVLGCTHYPLVEEVFRDARAGGGGLFAAPLVADSLADYLTRHPGMRGPGAEASFLTTGDARVSRRATQFLRREIPFSLCETGPLRCVASHRRTP